jgi:hypothetical protein
VLAPGFEADTFDQLADEYAREWPTERWPGGTTPSRGFSALLRQALQVKGEPLAWLIVQAPPGPASPAASDEKFACGVVMAVPLPAGLVPDGSRAANAEPVELFVWIRRGHRSMGIASSCLDSLIDVVRPVLPAATPSRPVRLWARYPDPDPGDDDLEFATWSAFFLRFDFRPWPHPASSARCTLLFREWRCSSAAGPASVVGESNPTTPDP